MAFFKFRLPGQNTAEAQGSFSNPQAESVETMRRRARHRLMGASVLVLIGVIGFPLVFDTQPRPVASDIRIDIPERNEAAERATLTPAQTAPPLQAAATLDPKEELVDKKNTPPKDTAVTPASAVTAAQPEASVATPATSADPVPAADKTEAPRFVVQVGAYSDEAKVREVRIKIEKAGLKTYTQVAETKEGKRVRVRLGPFASRDEAEKAVAKLKPLNFQAQILSL